MEKLGVNEIRELFLSFYESKEHYRQHSFSLIPRNDKSLLIINSGMAPLKPFFAGIEEPPAHRMTTCQKCIRTGDIDNVGKTARHGTFFEMMGSFSFGDYFKKESITWGWEFITKVLKMPEERIWATVYENDDDAAEYWKAVGIPEERIVRLGKDDNFWEIGLGPCGPCSELYFDRGEEWGCGSEDCKPGCDCDRYCEFWNHVFTQFDRHEDGTYTDLPKPNIDTGLGLERLACIMQGVSSIFDVDTIRYILEGVVEKSGVEYRDGELETDVSIRIITDHIRSITFMLSDDIMPSNEGRGYVLRRLLRRAARHGRVLGIEGPFLSELASRVVKVSGAGYPELVEKEEYIRKIISIEEEKFAATIGQGETILGEYIEEMKALGSKTLPGEKAFKLYDTYGFPVDLTKEILEEQGYTTDIAEFEKYMEIQKETARAGGKALTSEDEGWKKGSSRFENLAETVFTGYTDSEAEAKVLTVEKEGDNLLVILDKTPFYATSGGQINDFGMLKNDSFSGKVTDVTKENGIFIHKVENAEGEIAAGDSVHAEICRICRNCSARNHSATHILQSALREVFGNHIAQAGSRVTQDTLRFDFNHYEAMTAEQIAAVEKIVNEHILEFAPVCTEVMTIDEAKKSGATALFDEKYGSDVRVVSMGDFSKELCGGTHVANTGEIGAFRILSESGVAAGVRRIEAITGRAILAEYEGAQKQLDTIAEALKANTANVAQKAIALADENKALKKELEELKKQAMGDATGDLMSEAVEIGGVKLICKEFDGLDIGDLRSMSDNLKAENKGLILVFATVNGGKVTFMTSVSDDLLDKYHAGNMIKEIAKAAGGGGGGKADMAQAGAKDPSKINDAFEVAKSLI